MTTTNTSSSKLRMNYTNITTVSNLNLPRQEIDSSKTCGNKSLVRKTKTYYGPSRPIITWSEAAMGNRTLLYDWGYYETSVFEPTSQIFPISNVPNWLKLSPNGFPLNFSFLFQETWILGKQDTLHNIYYVIITSSTFLSGFAAIWVTVNWLIEPYFYMLEI